MSPTECTADAYLKQRPDVAAANQGARVHFVNFGLNENMCEPPVDQSAMVPSPPTPNYSPTTNTCTASEYLRRRPDLATNRWALSIECHYTLFGQREGMCEPSINSPGDFRAIQAACTGSVPSAGSGAGAGAGASAPAPSTPQPAPPAGCSGIMTSGPYTGFNIATDPNNPYHRALRDGEWYYAGGTIFSCGQMRPR